jgi:hypothetical protein
MGVASIGSLSRFEFQDLRRYAGDVLAQDGQAGIIGCRVVLADPEDLGRGGLDTF